MQGGRLRREILAELEDGIDESLGATVDLALREGPQFDRLRSSRQQVRDLLEGEQPRGSGEQELAGPRVQIDRVLDGEDEIGDALDLVDDQQTVVADERGGVGVGRAARTAASSRYRISVPGRPWATRHARVLLPVCRAPLRTTTLVSLSAAITRS